MRLLEVRRQITFSFFCHAYNEAFDLCPDASPSLARDGVCLLFLGFVSSVFDPLNWSYLSFSVPCFYQGCLFFCGVWVQRLLVPLSVT